MAVAGGAGARTPSRDVEQALVDAAERVLVRDGVGGLTVRAVATEAGVAPMGVYNRFGNKSGLIAAVLVRGFAGLRSAVAEVGGADPLARLVASGHGYRRFALAHPRHYAVMFGGGGMVVPDDEVPAELAEAGGSAFGALVDHVREAMGAGALRAGDAELVAQIVWSGVHGAVSLELAGNRPFADADATYAALLQVLVDGLR